MDKDTVITMAGRCAAAATEAQRWVERNEERVTSCGKSQEEVLKSLRRQAREFRKLERAAGRRMCAGVFGPSQAGKSYLVGSLARDTANLLECRFAGQTFDFIRDLNPAGGKESTGLVTRFTMVAPANIPQGYPVHVRLFSETELVKILANSYFRDSDPKAPPKPNTKETIRASVEALKGRATGMAPHITIDMMEDLHEYVRNSFGGSSRSSALDEEFWDDAIEMAPKMALEDRARLFSVIWDGIPEFTAMFLSLAADLMRLGNPEEAFCAMDALVPREASIIDVETLQRTDFSSLGAGPTVQMCSPTGQVAGISRKNATAIIAELTLVITHKPAEYFTHTDLLDFPGYKAHLECADIADYLRSDKADGTVEQFFRRGKVDYLFQRYSAERELTSLLLCVASTDIVPGLAKAVQEWIAATHGKTPEERQLTKNALFYILTKSDRYFEDVAGAKPRDRWNNALVGNFLSHFTGSYSHETRWVDEWTPGRPFNNLFLLRNISYRWDSLEFDSAAREVGIRADKQAYVEQMREAFIDSASVQKHFVSPTTAIDELLKLNDGGIEHVKRSLQPLCDPQLKLTQVGNALERARQTLLSTLAPFYHSGDKEEELKKKNELFGAFFNLFGSTIFRERFPELLNSFKISPETLFYMYGDAERRHREYLKETDAPNFNENGAPAPGGNPFGENPFGENPFGANPFGGAPASPAPAAPAPVKTKTKDVHSFYASRIIEAWSGNMHSTAETSECTSYYRFPKAILIRVLDEFDAAAARLELQLKLEEKFREIARPVDVSKDSKAHKQASYAIGVLNDFVSWLGKKPSDVRAHERRVNCWKGDMPVFADKPVVEDIPVLGDDFKPYSHAWMQDWLYAFHGMLIDNVTFTDGSKIDLEENAIIGEIIKKISN